jgi:hypothetical protein
LPQARQRQAIETLGRAAHIGSVSVFDGVGINLQIKKLNRKKGIWQPYTSWKISVNVVL